MATATGVTSGNTISEHPQQIEQKKRDATNSIIQAIVFLALSYVSFTFSMPILSAVLCFLGCTCVLTTVRLNSEKRHLQQELHLVKIQSGVSSL